MNLVSGVIVEKATDHSLVLGIVTVRFLLEEFDAGSGQLQCDFNRFLPKS